MGTRKDYSHVISGFRNELHVNSSTSLSGYCRSVGISISAVHHWMEKKGLSAKKIKSEVLSADTGNSPFVPLTMEASAACANSQNIHLVFPNGVRLSADQCSPEFVLALLNGYHGGRE